MDPQVQWAGAPRVSERLPPTLAAAPEKPGAHRPTPFIWGATRLRSAKHSLVPGGPRSSSPGLGKESYESEMTCKDKYFVS